MSNPYMEEAEVIRESIDGLAEGATDEKIVDNKAAFPWWNGNGVTYVTDNILRYNNSVYRVLQNHKVHMTHIKLEKKYLTMANIGLILTTIISMNLEFTDGKRLTSKIRRFNYARYFNKFYN